MRWQLNTKIKALSDKENNLLRNENGECAKTSRSSCQAWMDVRAVVMSRSVSPP